MTKLQHTIMIERPVEEVWDYVMDARNDPVWHSPTFTIDEDALPIGATVFAASVLHLLQNLQTRA